MEGLLISQLAPISPGPPWRVVLFDDQSTGMELFSPVLSRAHELKVLGTLKGMDNAIQQLRHLKPHLVILDLQAQRYSAIELIERLNLEFPTPVLLVIPPKRLEADRVIRAMELGPVSCFERPGTLKDFQTRTPELIQLCVQAAASFSESGARGALAPPIPPKAPPKEARPQREDPVGGAYPLVALGLSTGGPGVLVEFLNNLGEAPQAAILVAQHMLAGFMGALASRLKEQTGFPVQVVNRPMTLLAGTLYLPDEGKHLIVQGDPWEPQVNVIPMAEIPSPACPSVDVLFKSVGQIMGPKGLGLVFTGMGRDGLEGAKVIVEEGGTVWSQSRESCVVYGMPRGVEEAGLSSMVLSPASLALELSRLLEKTEP